MKYIVAFWLAFSFLALTQCKSDSSKKEVQSSDQETNNDLFIEKGKSITSSTFLALSTELQKAMKEGGPKNAIEYCNLNALSLTDSLSKLHSATIKRTSNKYRNPENKPTDQERVALDYYQRQLSLNQAMLPKVETDKNGTVFYAPIIVQDMCLKCHGDKENISIYDLIKEKYPEDLATGYKQGDLRGMWSVTFKK